MFKEILILPRKLVDDSAHLSDIQYILLRMKSESSFLTSGKEYLMTCCHIPVDQSPRDVTVALRS